MKKRAIAILMTIVLLLGFLPICASGSGLSKAERYEAAVGELKRYFDGEASMELTDLFEAFESLGWYSYSAQLAMYTAVFRDTEKQHYDEILLYIEMMRVDSRFHAYLTENEFPTLDEVESYALGQQAESEGRLDDAVSCYERCPWVLDSMMRYQLLKMQQVQRQYQEAVELLAEGTPESCRRAAELFAELAESNYRDSRKRLEEACRLAEECGAAQPEGGWIDAIGDAVPAPSVTPVPVASPASGMGSSFSLGAVFEGNYIRLNWIKPDGAASFEIYRRTNTTDWVKIATIKNEYYFDGDVKSYTTYKYYVKAVQGGEQSAEAKVTTGYIAPEATEVPPGCYDDTAYPETGNSNEIVLPPSD